LLAAAIRKKDAQHCSGVNITIEGVDNNFFVDKKDIINSIKLTVGGSPVGKAVSSFDLRKIESQLEKDIWVKAAQLFFDNNNRLMVYVLEREPVARVFTTGGTTFYIDTSLAMLPLSEKFSARLPVFTDFPSDKIVLSKADSALLKDILTISMAIQKDTFNMAMIDQVDITPQRSFEMIPKIGNNIIVFGDATNVEEKFYKLQLFYRQVMVKAGWSKYSKCAI
jgi:cell division protein FtsQ